ncbi:MAG: hypothetical protein DRN28_00395 [Thermoplasmata archaeon]|nr:MAG: hypothetical protein DRN28_00395 [Thermoplasmata archaeon]
MPELKDARIYGGIGALLALIGGIIPYPFRNLHPFIPYSGTAIQLVGMVLVFLAVWTISKVVRDRDIFKEYLISFILSIIAIVALFGIVFLVVGISHLSATRTLPTEGGEEVADSLPGIIGGVCGALIVAWIILIISAFYLKKSYERIAYYTGADLFRTTGLVYLIGTVTLIVLVGIFILFIAKILEIVAFFSLPDRPTWGAPPPPQPYPGYSYPPQPPPPEGSIYSTER